MCRNQRLLEPVLIYQTMLQHIYISYLMSIVKQFNIEDIFYPDILKVDFFLRGQNFSFEILRKKNC